MADLLEIPTTHKTLRLADKKPMMEWETGTLVQPWIIKTTWTMKLKATRYQEKVLQFFIWPTSQEK